MSVLLSKLRNGRIGQLPSDQSLTNLLQLVNTGYVAMKIGEKISYTKKDRNRLFFRLMTLSPDQLKFHEEPVVSAAAQMLEWCEKGEDLPEKISHFKGEKDLIRAMHEVYFDHKKMLFREKVVQNTASTRDRDDVWWVYRDVIAAATQNKLLLIEPHEVERFKEGIVLSEGRIEKRSDISAIRNKVKQCFEERQYARSAMMSFLLVLSEAMTNVFKHAEHGIVTIVEKDDALHFIVEDAGKGIPLEQLPRATLFAGYSTEKSMGQGFTVMLKIASCIHLHTSEHGSTLVMTFNHPDKADGTNSESEGAVPHVWGV